MEAGSYMKHSLATLIVLFLLVVISVSGCSSQEDVAVPPDITAALDKEDSHDDKVRLQEEIIRRQRMEIERQNRELEDLKRQQFYNESYRRFEQKN